MLKSAFLFDYNIVKLMLITTNKHLSHDTQLSSVTRNCQIYSMQLDTIKTGVFKLKKIMNFITVRRNSLYSKLCSFVSPNFRFKETRSVNVFTDPELSSPLYPEWGRRGHPRIPSGDSARYIDDGFEDEKRGNGEGKETLPSYSLLSLIKKLLRIIQIT